MPKNKSIIIGLFSFLMLFSFIPSSQAELWEFIVEANVENKIIHSGDTIVVTGKVVNHAYESTRGVEVLIRTGSETTKAFTDPNGDFRGEFTDFQRIPGIYTVNVIASWYGMTGLTSTEFQVKGDITQVTVLEERLSTDEAKKYLNASEEDFEKNPIGQTLFKYYQKLQEELIVEVSKVDKFQAEQVIIEQQRQIAENLRNQAIVEFKPGAGIFDGHRYEDHIMSLNPEIRDIISNQLNYTKDHFAEAQNARDEILSNGGTYEEARKAYLEMIAVPKEILDEFNQNQVEETSDETTDSQ